MDPESSSLEEELAAHLERFDEALLAGAEQPEQVLPAEVRARLDEHLTYTRELRELLSDKAESQNLAGMESTPRSGGGSYVLKRMHATGGIGQVWLAHDAELDRDVALKELRPERARNPTLVARFLREAQITGQLQHPGIVPIYDLMPGESARELPFYTMRFLHGRTLSQAVGAYHARRLGGSAGPLELSTLLNAFVSACQTVAYAHSRGIIHRDLKGENIELGEFGEVIVLDWGFAKILGESAGSPAGEDPVDANSSALQTQSGQVLGTPAYMAPEQASGHSERVDERTDVYGLGAILYEIITGRPPFEGRCTQEVLRKVRDECPARPETVTSGVPPALAAICMRALARDPAERYPGAGELGREVQSWLADEPVSVFRGTLVSRLLRHARHHRPVVTGLATLLVVSAAALILGTFLLEQERTRAGSILLEAALDEVQSSGRASRSGEAATLLP